MSALRVNGRHCFLLLAREPRQHAAGERQWRRAANPRSSRRRGCGRGCVPESGTFCPPGRVSAPASFPLVTPARSCL